MLALDLETYCLDSQHNRTPKIVCGSISDGDATEVLLWRDLKPLIPQILKDEVIGTNIKYDLFCIAAMEDSLLPDIIKALDAGKIIDISIAQALLDIYQGNLFINRLNNRKLLGYSLAYLTEYWLGIRTQKATSKHVGDAKQWRLRYALLDDWPLEKWPQEAMDYVKKDAIYPLRIWREQQKEQNNLHRLADEVRADWALEFTALGGLRTHEERVRVFSDKVRKQHESDVKYFLKKKFYKNVVTRNTGKLSKDMKYIQECVKDAYRGFPPLTKTGKVGTDASVLEQSGNPDLIAFAKISRNEKLFSGYLPLIQKGIRYPILPSYTVLMRTGRTSCRKPNAQNMPRARGVRECFIPAKGFLFSSSDYGALELCTLAQICYWWFKYSTLRGAINSGKDPHCMLGAQMLRMPYDKFIQLYSKGEARQEAIRQLAKLGNFGLAGGMGLGTWVSGLQDEGTKLCEIYDDQNECGTEKQFNNTTGTLICAHCLDVANLIKKAWLNCWPEMYDYFKYINDCVDQGGLITIPKGISRGGCTFTQGANFPFQGLAAQGAKKALWKVSRECLIVKKSPLYGSRPIIFVHDEIIAQHPIKIASEAADRLANVMVEAFVDVTPDVKVKVEPALMDCWQKKAKSKRGKDGKLIVNYYQGDGIC